MGNNENGPGPFGAETSYGLHAPSLWVIRTILAIKTTRIGQLLDAFGSRLRNNSSTRKEWGGMEMFANSRLGYDDPARLRAYANFKGNLEDILRAAHKAGVPVILSTVAVNLKDCAPFASIHAAGLNADAETAWNQIYQQGIALETSGSYRGALNLYQRAARIDPHFADLQFRLGTCDLALSNRVQALREFELARDYDALDFRADTRINSAIEEAASRNAGQGVHLLDASTIFAQNCPANIPGLELFYEHVHLNFAGNYLLALNFAEQTKQILPASIAARDKGSWASAQLCDDRLGETAWDRYRDWQPIRSRVTSPPFTGQFNHDAMLKVYEEKLEEAKSRMNLQTPAQAQQIYQQALASAPNDYFLHGNYERFLETGGCLTQAIAEGQTLLASWLHICRAATIMPACCWFAPETSPKPAAIFSGLSPFAATARMRKTPWEKYWRTNRSPPRPWIGSNAPSGPIGIIWKPISTSDFSSKPARGTMTRRWQVTTAGSEAWNRRPGGLFLPGEHGFLAASIGQKRAQCLRSAIKIRPDFWQSPLPVGRSTDGGGKNRRSGKTILGGNPLSAGLFPGAPGLGNRPGRAR